MRRISLDTYPAGLITPRTPPTAPMIGPAIQLGILRADLEGQNAAVVQACVPLVIINGPSYRLKGRLDTPRSQPVNDPSEA